jgi:uncharacterized protein (DUF1778 family)
MATPKKTRKPKALRKEDSIRIRVTEAQKEALTEAATKAGLGVSSWLLMLGLREAQRSETAKETR